MHKISTIVALCGMFLFTDAAFSQSAPVAELTKSAKYVALGSSFAAGSGIPVFLGSCGRSDHNYPHLVAAAIGLDLTDVSCGGATTAHILDTAQGNAAPQINAVTSDTALVTVTIGGNDIRYTASTFACAGSSNDKHCTANLDQAAINNAVNQLPARLAAVLDTIQKKAPQAIIVVVPYPRVFLSDAANCQELNLAADDISFLGALGQKLEDAFVSVASSRNIPVADAYVRAEGHGPCAALPDRWINGAKPAETGAPFHPTAAGHIEMARLVQAALASK